uniref:Epiregulin n=1 Tax=Cynoglossus semilaevis TaxID=244447 RepID=A0A3P8WSR4_CYNSE
MWTLHYCQPRTTSDSCTNKENNLNSNNSLVPMEGVAPRFGKHYNCDSTFDNYCLNQGQCMLLVDMNVHHCKCERGFYGPRCAKAELVFQPMAEEQMIVTVFCVCLLLIGLAGMTQKKKKKSFATHPRFTTQSMGNNV